MKSATVSPFPQAAKSVRRKTPIDPALMAIEHNTPPPDGRCVLGGKYHALFKQLKPGSCVRCEPSELAVVKERLRRALAENRYLALKGCRAQGATCEDGHARVWALKDEK